MLKNILQGGYKGGSLGALSHEAKFNQDIKYEVITLKKVKKTFLRTLQGGTIGFPLSRSKISAEDVNLRSLYSVRTEWVV